MSLCDKCGNDPMMTLTEQDAVAAAYDRDVAQVRVKQLEADLAAAKAERDSAKADWRDAAAEAHRLQTIQHEADRVGDNRHTLIETLRATIARAERAERERDEAVTRLIESVGPSDTKLADLEAKLADRDATIERLRDALRAVRPPQHVHEDRCDTQMPLAEWRECSCGADNVRDTIDAALAAPATTPGPSLREMATRAIAAQEKREAELAAMSPGEREAAIEVWAQKLASDSVACGESEYGVQSGDAKGEAPRDPVIFTGECEVCAMLWALLTSSMKETCRKYAHPVEAKSEAPDATCARCGEWRVKHPWRTGDDYCNDFVAHDDHET